MDARKLKDVPPRPVPPSEIKPPSIAIGEGRGGSTPTPPRM
jgi:hypothetical protein